MSNVASSTTVGGDVDAVTVCTVPTSTITASNAAHCRNISSDSTGRRLVGKPVLYLRKRLAPSLSRLYDVAGGTAVGGDGDTVTVCTAPTATITTNRAAHCRNISGDSTGGA